MLFRSIHHGARREGRETERGGRDRERERERERGSEGAAEWTSKLFICVLNLVMTVNEGERVCRAHSSRTSVIQSRNSPETALKQPQYHPQYQYQYRWTHCRLGVKHQTGEWISLGRERRGFDFTAAPVTYPQISSIPVDIPTDNHPSLF